MRSAPRRGRGPQRDLQRRAPDEVRGSKALWRLVCLNVLGAAVYLRWGRRQRQPPWGDSAS